LALGDIDLVAERYFDTLRQRPRDRGPHTASGTDGKLLGRRGPRLGILIRLRNAHADNASMPLGIVNCLLGSGTIDLADG